MAKIFLVLVVSIYGILYGQVSEPICGTLDMPLEEVINIKQNVELWKENRSRDTTAVHILVAWHVITNSAGYGDYSDDAIAQTIESLNDDYLVHNIFFTLDTIQRVANDDWFNNWYDIHSEGMQVLSYDPYHYLNIYTADLLSSGVQGFAYLGNQYTASHYRQSVSLDHDRINSTWVVTHEVGHHLGLPHTFQGNCSNPNDGIDDTPQHSENGLWSCNINQDTCPNDPGNDPVNNYMNYSGSCQTEYTPGQHDWQHYIIENYHPGYLDNNFNFPLLAVNSLTYLQDTDGDNQFNPGDTTRVKVILSNNWGGDAVNIEVALSTDDDRITILDNHIDFNGSPIGDIIIPAQEIGSTVFDWFLVSADEDAVTGSVPCVMTITAGTDEYPYQVVENIALELTLSQSGFPLEPIIVKSSPIVADLDTDGYKEIFFGSDNNLLHGYNSYGQELTGFPFQSTDRVRSSPAIGDVDNDGEMEIVFGNSAGKLYVVDKSGNRELAYTLLGFIEGAPALVDIDGDQDLEIVFTTTSGSNLSGQVYVIHHNGITESGFPKEIGSMWAGPAVHDLDNDGVVDVICVTYDKEIYAIEAIGGAIKPGFPFTAESRFSMPATIVDVDSDGDYEIAAGCNSGDLYILHHDGSIHAQYNTGDDIRGGISVCDLNNDGQLDLLFGGYDDRIHVWDPMAGELLPGWPVDLGYNSLSEPLIADLDGDGQVEVLAARKTGKIFAYESDGTLMGNFPIPVDGSIESSPAIEDIDNDGDLELIIGTTAGLEVIDIKFDAELMDSWSMYRGNMHRTGVYDASVMALDGPESIIPTQFYVSDNYPNPFNPTTSFYIDVPESGNLLVRVYDVNGRLVKELINTHVEVGRVSSKWSGKNDFGVMSPTGIYFLQVETGSNYHVQKLALIK